MAGHGALAEWERRAPLPQQPASQIKDASGRYAPPIRALPVHRGSQDFLSEDGVEGHLRQRHVDAIRGNLHQGEGHLARAHKGRRTTDVNPRVIAREDETVTFTTVANSVGGSVADPHPLPRNRRESFKVLHPQPECTAMPESQPAHTNMTGKGTPGLVMAPAADHCIFLGEQMPRVERSYALSSNLRSERQVCIEKKGC
eukprot:6053094-Prymnesium_polylepis.1